MNMREDKFKFRGQKPSGEWVVGNLILGLNGVAFIAIINEKPIERNGGSWYINTPCFVVKSIGEFTGLQDKNEVDIYEGDILEYKNELGRHHLAQIFYKKGGLCFNIHEDDFYKNSEEIYFYESCADMQSKGWIVQFEVIGNIYETPELLNK